MPDVLENFHFLRPAWLLLLLFAVWLYFRLRGVVSAADQWRGVIAPELLKHLVTGADGERRIRPYQVLAVLLCLLSLALAGPSWERELTPFTEDRAPLVIVLELNTNMLAIDQPPTRLARAKQKIGDIVERRQGARTALIAYAGSAHLVLPLTEDASLIRLYLDSLQPDLMPVDGDDPLAALQLATSLLDTESAAGSILFMTDGIDRSRAAPIASKLGNREEQLLLHAFGTESGGPLLEQTGAPAAPGADIAGLRAVAASTGGILTRASVDESDIDRLLASVNTHLVNAIDADENLRWVDAGYWLVWPLALLALLWFRRGWTIQWQ